MDNQMCSERETIYLAIALAYLKKDYKALRELELLERRHFDSCPICQPGTNSTTYQQLWPTAGIGIDP